MQSQLIALADEAGWTFLSGSARARRGPSLEKRTGISNVSNTAYPILARNLRTRRDNLLATITTLEIETGA
jgi:hypothetical protein